MRRATDERGYRRCDLCHSYRRLVSCSLRVRGSGDAATRSHSARPVLELRAGLRQGGTAGLQLINAGLGPAAITKTVLALDVSHLGSSARRASTYSAASSR